MTQFEFIEGTEPDPPTNRAIDRVRAARALGNLQNQDNQTRRDRQRKPFVNQGTGARSLTGGLLPTRAITNGARPSGKAGLVIPSGGLLFAGGMSRARTRAREEEIRLPSARMPVLYSQLLFGPLRIKYWLGGDREIPLLIYEMPLSTTVDPPLQAWVAAEPGRVVIEVQVGITGTSNVAANYAYEVSGELITPIASGQTWRGDMSASMILSSPDPCLDAYIRSPLVNLLEGRLHQAYNTASESESTPYSTPLELNPLFDAPRDSTVFAKPFASVPGACSVNLTEASAVVNNFQINRGAVSDPSEAVVVGISPLLED